MFENVIYIKKDGQVIYKRTVGIVTRENNSNNNSVTPSVKSKWRR